MASFRVHQDQENICEPPQRPVRVNRSNNAPVQPQKRAVLGLINNNPIQTRARTQKQAKAEAKPSLTVKPALTAGNDENKQKAVAQAKPKTSFFIHEDKPVDEQKDVKSKTLVVERKPVAKLSELPSTISLTTLHRPPLQELVPNIPEDDVAYVSLEASPCSEISKPDDEAEKVTNQKPKPTLTTLIECHEYKKDIYHYLLDAESRHRPRPYYMKKQPDITYSMRSILVDWLVEVAEEYRLQTETLYLAVSYVDRFLSLMSVVRSKLQLVGTAAMFVAAKYEEIYPPEVGEFVYITDDTYNKRQVLRMEHLILKVLGFDISTPTCFSFIVNFCSASEPKASEDVLYLAMYISELSLLDADPFLDHVPSVRAASCLALARHTLGELPAWSSDLAQLTTYELRDLAPCIAQLYVTYRAAPQHAQQAVRDKYRCDSRRNVTSVEPCGYPTVDL